MKKQRIILICVILTVSSSIVGCSGYNELFEITDHFVESLYTTYESYGLQGERHTKFTSDGLYKVMPVGRLINVRIEKVVDDEEYEKLRAALEKHYKNDTRVNGVYIAEAGTVMIDCRN